MKEAIEIFYEELKLKDPKLTDQDIDQMLSSGRSLEQIIDTYNLDRVRVCSECGKLMTSGFVIENGLNYYCSDECLLKNMSWSEYEELYDDGFGDSYWTEWE